MSNKSPSVTGDVNAALAADRVRIDTIISSEEGRARPKAALQLALRSSMSLEEARDFLALGPAESPYLAVMEREGPINLGGQNVGASVSGDARAARLAEISGAMKHFNQIAGYTVK